MTDQSSGYGKKMEEGLNVPEMSVRYGINYPNRRDTVINQFCSYRSQFQVVIVQLLTSTSGDNNGLFYLSAEEREGLKFDLFTGEKR